MPKPDVSLVTTTQMRRLFFQPGGPLPGNVPVFAGKNGQYMALQGVQRPLRNIEPIRLYDPSRSRRYIIAGRRISAPDFPTATLRILESRGTLPFQLGDLSCPFNLYLPVGACKDPSAFLTGWDILVEIVSWAEATQVDEGDRMAWEEDNMVEDAVAVTLEAKYAIAALSISAEASANIDREVIDVIYGGGVQCGDCGPSNDGTSRVYAVTTTSGAASPGLPAEVTYTIDGGLTWTSVGIDGFGATEAPVAIDIAGDFLIVVGADAYYWATLNRRGVPGTFTKVSTGFVAAGSPLDLYVLAPNEIFFSGEAGYIYRSTNVAAGVEVIDNGNATTSNLLRIHGDGLNTLVAVGADSAVIRSVNRGLAWATTLAEPFDIPLDCYSVCVKGPEVYFVGSGNSGRMEYTLDGGETWTPIAFTGTGQGYVRDIVAGTDEVMWMVHDDNTPTGRLWASWDGGQSWVRNDGGSQRVLNWPVIDRVNRIATPNSTRQISGNYVALGGLAGDGTDGVLLLGTPNLV